MSQSTLGSYDGVPLLTSAAQFIYVFLCVYLLVCVREMTLYTARVKRERDPARGLRDFKFIGKLFR